MSIDIEESSFFISYEEIASNEIKKPSGQDAHLAEWKFIAAGSARARKCHPTNSVFKELPNLKQIPERDWFAKLFSKDTDERTEMMLSIIDWAILFL